MAKLGIVKYLKASHGSRQHEHHFKIELTLEGKIKNDYVDGIDFHDVKNAFEEELAKMENKYLNDYLQVRATVENIGIYLLKVLSDRGVNNLYAIKIFEEENRFVKIYFNEIKEN